MGMGEGGQGVMTALRLCTLSDTNPSDVTVCKSPSVLRFFFVLPVSIINTKGVSLLLTLRVSLLTLDS